MRFYEGVVVRLGGEDGGCGGEVLAEAEELVLEVWLWGGGREGRELDL